MANKKESSLVNMVLTLFIITLIASASLGFIYEITKLPIKEAKIAKKTKAIEKVLPEFDNLEEMKVVKATDKGRDFEFYNAKKGGKIIGTAVKTSTESGYSGLIWIMVGFTADGKIYKTSVLEHKETPGLGTKLDETAFKKQFLGKNPDNFKLIVKKDGGDVDAITAATISSRAFCEAVQRAFDAYKKQK